MPLSAAIVGRELPPVDVQWDARDVMLYALGVGARPDAELDLVYEGRGPVVLPTYALIASYESVKTVGSLLAPDRFGMVHATQHLELARVLAPEGRARVQARVTALWDKGKHSLIELTSEGTDDAGPLFQARATTMILNSGGWGGERGPATDAATPEGPPVAEVHDTVRPEQAALYRLSGDRNPMHIDPEAAKRFGFDDVFLHGLCTLGFAARVVIASAAQGDATRVKSIGCRFSARVPLDCSLTTRVWSDSARDTVQFESQVDDNVVLGAGYATLWPDGTHG